MDVLFGLNKPSAIPDGMSLLTTVHGNVELSVVRSILEGEGIAFYLRDRGAGGVLRIVAGDSPFECDVLVPADLLEQATEILDAYRNGTPVEDADFVAEEDSE